MFCPKCATQNSEGARFCRTCGADISLVSQALTGQIYPPAEVESEREVSRRERKHGKHPSVERGIKVAFMGMGFALVALALAFSRGGRGWWFWMLIPAFSMLGAGIGEYLRARNAQGTPPVQTGPTQTAVPRAPHLNELPPRSTSELMPPPPSVTEGTTRHLGAEAPTKVFVTPPKRDV